MINSNQSTLLLYSWKDVKSHRSGGDTVPLIVSRKFTSNALAREAVDKCRQARCGTLI